MIPSEDSLKTTSKNENIYKNNHRNIAHVHPLVCYYKTIRVGIYSRFYCKTNFSICNNASRNFRVNQVYNINK